MIYEYAFSNYLFSLWQISCETINTAPGSSRVDTTIHNDYKATECVIPENIHTSPTEGIFFKEPPPPPLWKFQLSFIHFFKFFGLIEPPTPQEIPIPSVGGVWIFSGTVP